MLGCRFGFVARVSRVNPNIKKLHCMIHRYALCTKTLPAAFKSVLDDVVAPVNFVKANPLNTRMLRLLCQELNAELETLLLHTEVRWLSRGTVLARVECMKTELKELFSRNPTDKAKRFAQYLGDSISQRRFISTQRGQLITTRKLGFHHRLCGQTKIVSNEVSVVE